MPVEDADDKKVQAGAFTDGMSALFQHHTGKSYDDVASTAMTESPSAMLSYLYPGRNERQPVDTATAAKRFKVSQRTMQRWIKDDRIPHEDQLKKLRTRTRQTVTTKRGRAQTAKRMAATAEKPDATRRIITIHGLQGPTTNPNSTGSDRPRYGKANLEMTPDQQAALYEAYANGGAEAAEQYLTSAYDAGYVAGWHFHGIDGISWKNVSN